MGKMTYRYWINKEGKPFTGGYYEFKSFKVYMSYREYVAKELHRKAFNESFTGQFLKAGFDTFGIGLSIKPPGLFIAPKQINPMNNWFGTSLYEPDTIFIKGNKEMIMSIQGIGSEWNEKYKELFESVSIRYIKLIDNDKVIYENWTGELPPKEIVKEFLN